MAFNKCFIKSSVAGVILALSILASAQTTGRATLRSGSVVRSGLKTHEEICRVDEAMALLHEGAETIEILKRIVPSLSGDWNMTTANEHVHRHTRASHQPFCYETMAGDVATLINYLSRVV